jgi:hypothetical protein
MLVIAARILVIAARILVIAARFELVVEEVRSPAECTSEVCQLPLGHSGSVGMRRQ